MRARMALAYSKVSYEHREILLRKRPKTLYEISPKGTVPVLQLSGGNIIDQSLDIMKWCLDHNDPNNWYSDKSYEQNKMINDNDQKFKYWLDKYKYHNRSKENSFEEYQKKIESFFDNYDSKLKDQSYFFGNQITLTDVALMPFIRQAAHVDIIWFENKFLYLSNWLEKFKGSNLFLSIMRKYEIWEENKQGIKVKWD